MNASYLLYDKETECFTVATVAQVLEIINRNRPAGWSEYNIADWRYGLEYTNFEVIE